MNFILHGGQGSVWIWTGPALVTRDKYRPGLSFASSVSTLMARPDFLQYLAYHRHIWPISPAKFVVNNVLFRLESYLFFCVKIIISHEICRNYSMKSNYIHSILSKLRKQHFRNYFVVCKVLGETVKEFIIWNIKGLENESFGEKNNVFPNPKKCNLRLFWSNDCLCWCRRGVVRSRTVLITSATSFIRG